MANYDSSSSNLSKSSVKTYSDLNLEFNRNVMTNDISKIKGVDAVKRSVRNLIQTAFYERPFHPEMGCGVRELLFENFTPATSMFIQRKIEEVITNYETRARLHQISVNEQPDRNAIEATTYFYVENLPEPVVVTTVLQRIR